MRVRLRLRPQGSPILDDARATIAACFDEGTAGSGELDRCDDDVSCVPDTPCARPCVLANESQGLGWFVEVDKPPSPLELEVIDTPEDLAHPRGRAGTAGVLEQQRVVKAGTQAGGKRDVARKTHSQKTCASGMTARLSSCQVERVRQRCNDLRERDVTRSVL